MKELYWINQNKVGVVSLMENHVKLDTGKKACFMEIHMSSSGQIILQKMDVKKLMDGLKMGNTQERKIIKISSTMKIIPSGGIKRITSLNCIKSYTLIILSFSIWKKDLHLKITNISVTLNNALLIPSLNQRIWKKPKMKFIIKYLSISK